MKFFFPLLLAFLFLGFIPVSAQSSSTKNLFFGGQNREYLLRTPGIYDGTTPVPLILNLHGYGSQNWQQELYGDFRPIADTANFILVHPNGTFDGQGNRYWNTFGGSNVDDVGFLNALIDTISAVYNIDQNRIYSTGMSNGGFMSYELACQLSPRIAAIASVTGSMLPSYLNNCNALHPTPVMQIHGTADPTVPYNGGTNFLHIDSLVDHWVDFNNCTPTPGFTQVPDTDSTDGCTAEHYVWSGGDLGTSVEFFKIISGAHTWPGAPFVIGVTNNDINACLEIWRFFSQYTLDQLYTSRKPELSILENMVYPNPSRGVFNLRISNAEPTSISVKNALGQLVLEKEAKGNDLSFELLQKGFYLLTLRQGERIETHKLLVE